MQAVLLTALLAGATANPVQKTVYTDSHDYKVVCYYGSWAVYRPGDGKFPVEEIDPFVCTHLIYGFAGLGFDNRIKSLDSWNDLKENYGRGAFERFTTNLKAKNPRLKTIIAIGGWNEGSIKYSAMAESPSSRKIFVDSVVEFCKKYNFDGLDMDWEYPASRGGKSKDKQNFLALLRELKDAFKQDNLLLTAAVSAGKHFIDPAYDIPGISKYLDLINIMAYDFHGGWETKAGHHAPMFSRPEEPADERILNLNYSVNYWISQGACPKKITLGMGLYGRTFTLRREEDNSPGDEAPQKGRAGPYTREPGSLGYNEICEDQMRDGWTVVQDPYFMSPYAFKERQWVGYDDISSIEVKARFAKSLGLAGGMVWSIETDDFKGKCHGYRYPLISAINRVFAEPGIPDLPVPPSDPPTTPAPPSTASTEKTWWPRPSTSTMRPSSQSTALTSTTATTITTTMKPDNSTTRPPETDMDSEFKCSTQGIFRDPSNCQVFFECVPGTDGLIAFKKECASGTVFDPIKNQCAWPHDVPECKGYSAPADLDIDVKQEIAS
ncbi:chitinase-3-like protein 1 [Varroa destructor]|uniref:chitinase n=1 Tax=Varroa destructor TaxID=109461 RepID=A0A7M7K6L0_VARDE|nr:chitinase-3-like protein 1 [Varroa destructor]XP_022662426.1 chitinase-3-like protein 1 [Varroa destructor]XP_022662427.1 chitinase-3-like protein 1 [Varroa destructor]XP_022662428.1 chitinase-3-like protein 1 [Varroa destructor]